MLVLLIISSKFQLNTKLKILSKNVMFVYLEVSLLKFLLHFAINLFLMTLGLLWGYLYGCCIMKCYKQLPKEYL